ncbi:ATP-binding protein [Desulfothermus naphthae]
MKKKIPYGLTDFVRIQTENYYYIDKTRFISEIEEDDNFLFLLRPRCFGKSLWLSVLECYYDLNYESIFDKVFKGTYVYNHRTRLKNKFHILKLDFSAIDVTDYENSFRNYLKNKIKDFCLRYKLHIDFDSSNPIDMLNILFDYMKRDNLFLYIIIDEYDNFVNKVLIESISEYKKIISTKEGIYKQFFTTLKSGTTGSNAPIKKMFITGVSPLALYDVTSGSNISSNISLKERYNDILGITPEELELLIEYYGLKVNREKILSRADEWYGNYRFNEEKEYTIYNTDMIMYYLKHLINEGKEPQELVDVNVRTDYSKLRYLLITSSKLNGNFEELNNLIQDNPVTIGTIVQDFSAFEVADRDNFLFFMFFLGFVTIEKYRLALRMTIPHQTIKRLMGEFLYKGLKSVDFNFYIHKFNEYMLDFAYEKRLEAFYYLAEEIKKNSSIRDYFTGEGFLKGFMVSTLVLCPYYEVLTEQEVTKGYVDIVLNPIREEIPYGGIIELKYISRKRKWKELLNKKIEEGKEQLKKYTPKNVRQLLDKEFIKVLIVYRGWEMVYCERVL